MNRKHIATVIAVTLMLTGVAAAGIAYEEYTEPYYETSVEPMPVMTPDADGDRPGVVDADDFNTTGNVTVEDAARTEVGNG